MQSTNRVGVSPACLVFFLEQFILVYWPDEDCVSVVSEESVEGTNDMGEPCAVKLGKKVYSGRTAAIGKLGGLLWL